MNKARRKSLNELMGRIENVQSEIAEILEELDSLRGEEEEYRDNMPENFWSSEKYERADEAVDSLDTAYDALESADSDLTEAADAIEEAI